MGERTDEMRHDPNPLVDTVDGPEVVRSQIGPDPALGGGVGGGAVVDEAEVERVEIERTRADMGETVDAIQQRLSPESLKEQAKDRVKEATVGKAQGAGSTIVETVRANPLPAALTGLGLGWLFMSARRQSSAQLRYQGKPYGYPSHYEERDPSGPSTGQAVERARDKVGETASQAQDKAGQVASQAQDQVSRLGDQTRYQARRASGGFQRMLQENPLVVGALAVGTGAAVGLAIPETAKEHEVMGEARDTFVEKAQEKAEEAQQKVQRVAEEAQSAAK
ncbi:MAG: DUF3618 domain-containing protein, partial [Actinobacteria bacterium]|nr:DUF3618 domain-containing protein [Actinomycetota bacterium]